jgi:hypothetical protein
LRGAIESMTEGCQVVRAIRASKGLPDARFGQLRLLLKLVAKTVDF